MRPVFCVNCSFWMIASMGRLGAVYFYIEGATNARFNLYNNRPINQPLRFNCEKILVWRVYKIIHLQKEQ